jgi:hypothetical protein
MRPCVLVAVVSAGGGCAAVSVVVGAIVSVAGGAVLVLLFIG